MIKPPELDSAEGGLVWNALTASDDGDVNTLRRLLEGHPRLSRAEYWYTPAIHFAVREGHLEAVGLLLDAGADPEWNGLHDGSLIAMARDRGHADIARLLEVMRDRRGRVPPGSDNHPIHAAITRDDTDEVRRLLDADSVLVGVGNDIGASPLHRAVGRGLHELAALLLDRGANVHAVLSSACGLGGGFWTDLQPIDLAIWDGRLPGDRDMIRVLLDHGATLDLTVAAALGDIERVRQILDAEPARIRDTRPSGRRPLSAAIEAGHDAIARLLLERAVDPNWGEPGAPQGRSLQVAAAAGKREMVALLLAHGADPNSGVDSSGNAVSAAATPEIRALLVARGGRPDPYDTSWIDDDDELRLVAGDPRDAVRISAAFAMVAGDGRRDRLERLLTAGLRVPPVLTGCQAYLLTHTDMLPTLLAHGMSPDLMNWQHQTLLHLVCARDYRGRDKTNGAVERATILLDAGANISARDDEYRSTPLAWAARTNTVEMVAFLLARGAPTNLTDDEPWATPLAWAERRQHAEVVSILQQHGAGPGRQPSGS